MDTWTYGDAVAPEKYRDRRIGWSRHLGQGEARRQPLCPSGQRPSLRHRPEHHGTARDRGHRRASRRREVMGEYVPPLIPERIRAHSTREPLKPLEIAQPEGPSFTLDGQPASSWQNWSLRVGFNHREGMTLHTISYNDGDEVRSIAHRLSFAEMMVPYRDPSEDHFRRTAFDIGEWGLGFMTTSLELGCDCLGEIRYIDAVMHDCERRALRDPERLLHPRRGQRRAVEARRPRRRRRGAPDAPAHRLVPRDRRELRVPRLLALLPRRQHRMRGARHRHHGDHTHREPAQAHPNGTLVDKRTYAPFHQHFIMARMDLDVDGTENTVYAQRNRDRADRPRATRTASSLVQATPRCAPNRGPRRLGLEDAARLEGRERATRTTHRKPGPSYKLVPGGAIPARSSIPARPCSSAPR